MNLDFGQGTTWDRKRGWGREGQVVGLRTCRVLERQRKGCDGGEGWSDPERVSCRRQTGGNSQNLCSDSAEKDRISWSQGGSPTPVSDHSGGAGTG